MVSYSTKNWMSLLDGEVNLSQISIPGSHETMALYGVASYGQCQDKSLEEQLSLGVRYIDIRCRYVGDVNDESFAIHHGSLFQEKMFGDVLNDVQKFLSYNPTETIIMRVKQEYSTVSDSDFNRVFNKYVERYKSLFWDNGGNVFQNPRLKDIRGKIVVLYNVAGLNFGLSYPHNFRIQDDYSPYSQDSKWSSVKQHLDEAKNFNFNYIYINHLSAAPSWNTPYGVAWGNAWTSGLGINERAYNYFRDQQTSNRFGIIAMDYIRDTIVNKVIETNFKKETIVDIYGNDVNPSKNYRLKITLDDGSIYYAKNGSGNTWCWLYGTTNQNDGHIYQFITTDAGSEVGLKSRVQFKHVGNGWRWYLQRIVYPGYPNGGIYLQSGVGEYFLLNEVSKGKYTIRHADNGYNVYFRKSDQSFVVANPGESYNISFVPVY